MYLKRRIPPIAVWVAKMEPEKEEFCYWRHKYCDASCNSKRALAAGQTYSEKKGQLCSLRLKTKTDILERPGSKLCLLTEAASSSSFVVTCTILGITGYNFFHYGSIISSKGNYNVSCHLQLGASVLEPYFCSSWVIMFVVIPESGFICLMGIIGTVDVQQMCWLPW